MGLFDFLKGKNTGIIPKDPRKTFDIHLRGDRVELIGLDGQIHYSKEDLLKANTAFFQRNSKFREFEEKESGKSKEEKDMDWLKINLDANSKNKGKPISTVSLDKAEEEDIEYMRVMIKSIEDIKLPDRKF